MTLVQSIKHRYQRYRTLATDRVTALPIVILMPHSACNCRCVMCDIWKDNKNLKQLNEEDIAGLLHSLRKLGTRRVLMSGGEALLNPLFFDFCRLLKAEGMAVSLLSTGLTLEKNAAAIVSLVDELILSLDGDPELHDRIRNIPGAFGKMRDGVKAIRRLDPGFRITGRTVIHRLNFRSWIPIVETALALGLDRISFLPADVSSHAFNRQVLWTDARQDEIRPAEEELGELHGVTEELIRYLAENDLGDFVAEKAAKLRAIHRHYSALWGIDEFPYKKCNAPWVSTVVEADGTVRPCFFHPPIGNIREGSLAEILNGTEALKFRRELDMEKNETCRKCVCYLNLSPQNDLSR
jgi:MoaA/NifB/PqqE/SkfB family radical SAM enzyme